MEDLLKLRALLRKLGGALACVIVACGFGAKYFYAVPALDKLMHFEAEVLGVSERPARNRWSTPYTEVRFLTKNGRYRYPEEFPRRDMISSLRLGDRLEVWADLEGDYVLYQVRKNGADVATYDELVAATKTRKKWFPFVSLFSLGLGCFWFYEAVTRHGINPREERPG
jgi:hypothetical protein